MNKNYHSRSHDDFREFTRIDTFREVNNGRTYIAPQSGTKMIIKHHFLTTRESLFRCVQGDQLNPSTASETLKLKRILAENKNVAIVNTYLRKHVVSEWKFEIKLPGADAW